MLTIRKQTVVYQEVDLVPPSDGSQLESWGAAVSEWLSGFKVNSRLLLNPSHDEVWFGIGEYQYHCWTDRWIHVVRCWTDPITAQPMHDVQIRWVAQDG